MILANQGRDHRQSLKAIRQIYLQRATLLKPATLSSHASTRIQRRGIRIPCFYSTLG